MRYLLKLFEAGRTELIQVQIKPEFSNNTKITPFYFSCLNGL